jgi:predicted permease
MLETDTRGEDFPAVTDAQRSSFLASTINVVPAARGVSNLRTGLRRPLWVLMGGTLLLLLLTSLNIAGLMLARGAARTRELTTRMALGASRHRIARQLLVESLLITATGGLLGIGMAPLAARALRSFVAEGANITAAVDVRVLIFAILVTIVTGMLCALAPVAQTGRLPMSAAFTDRSGLTAGGAVRLRKLLVAGQLAFAIILLMAAGLFVQTLGRLQDKGPGFETSNLVMVGVDPTSVGLDYEQAERAMREVFRRIQQLTEVERMALANTSGILAGGSQTTTMTLEGAERQVSDGPVHFMRVTPGFFSTLGIPILAGRDFDIRDERPAGTDPGPFRTVVVNETFARRYFGDRSPIGARLARGIGPNVAPDIEIIGVVRGFSRRDLRDEELDQVFFNYWDNQSDNGAFYIKVRGSPVAAFASIRAAVAGVLPTHLVPTITTLSDRIEQSLWTERALATLSTAFGALALLICIIGVYGVMAFVAAQRTQEIGLRLALGATRRSAAWVVVGDALVMIASGAALAIPAALALRRLVESELFGIEAFDGPTILTAGGGLMLVAVGAAAIPAWRAVILPPLEAIRDQPESMWHAARRTVQRAVREIADSFERPEASPSALLAEFGGLVQRSASFSEAMNVALATLRERVGAQSVILLERAEDAFADGTYSIAADGLLLNRLAAYRHPLPITSGDLQTWRTWAEERRPRHIEEVALLERMRVRLAVPLRTRSAIVGVLLLEPEAGRESFTAAERGILGTAADVFALMLENGRLSARALEQERLRRDLALAAEVQRRLLPPRPPVAAGLSLAAFTLPARTVGGDYYDFVELPDGQLGIALADIAGKGVAAALLMSVVQASLRVLTSNGSLECAQLAAKMNGFLYRSTATNSYATFFYARADPARGVLQYVNAGHNPPYLVRRAVTGVEIVELNAGGTVLGLFPDLPYEEAAVDIRPGDVLVAFTDGVSEARNADGEEFGEGRLRELLQTTVGAPAEQVASLLAARMREWSAGAEQHDDLTFVVVSVDEQGGSCHKEHKV